MIRSVHTLYHIRKWERGEDYLLENLVYLNTHIDRHLPDDVARIPSDAPAARMYSVVDGSQI